MSRPLITNQDFKGLSARHGFQLAEKGASEVFDAYLKAETAKVTVQAILQADHENRKGLTGKHAKKAIELTPEIPAGIY